MVRLIEKNRHYRYYRLLWTDPEEEGEAQWCPTSARIAEGMF